MIRNVVEDRMIDMIDRLHGNAEPEAIPHFFSKLFPKVQRERRILRWVDGVKVLEPIK